jgi:hypothetical protein
MAGAWSISVQAVYYEARASKFYIMFISAESVKEKEN